MEIMTIVRGIIGMALLVSIGVLFSNNRKKISWALVGKGLLIQLFFAIFIIHSETLRGFFFILGWIKDGVSLLGSGVVKLLDFITIGSEFVFGGLASPAGTKGSMGFFFAFQVLPTILFFAALTSVLYYLGILQAIVKVMAKVMAKLLGTSGAESLSNTANIFIGQTEAPILIKPYIGTMTRSEILTIMVGGMATVAGGVLATYIQILGEAMASLQDIDYMTLIESIRNLSFIPFGSEIGHGMDVSKEAFHLIALKGAKLDFAVHLITASVMAAPASIVISKILYPETEVPKTKGTVKLKVEQTASNVIEAAANGTSEGLKLALNVGAMLLVFIALIQMINFILISIGGIELFGLPSLNSIIAESFGAGHKLSMEFVLGNIFRYLAIGIGVPVKDALAFGSLFGTKIVVNEFLAYINLVEIIKTGALHSKSIVMLTFALCGFANFSSIAIQIGGIAPMAPHRKKDIASLGLKALLGGLIATLMNATLAGVLL